MHEIHDKSNPSHSISIQIEKEINDIFEIILNEYGSQMIDLIRVLHIYDHF